MNQTSRGTSHSKIKWNRTLRIASPVFHTAGCSMNNKAKTCADWLRHQLDVAESNWESKPSVQCLPLPKDVVLPRKFKGSDSFIPFGQGRDVVIDTDEARRMERAAVKQVFRRACEFAGRKDVCISNMTKHV